MTARRDLPPPDGGDALSDALRRRLEPDPPTPAAAPQRPPRGRERAAPAAPPAPEADPALLARWRWQLGATARKAAAAAARADAAHADWLRLAADAAAAGIPARLVVAAAADAGLDTPGGE
jgi:hypothetical protein